MKKLKVRPYYAILIILILPVLCLAENRDEVKNWNLNFEKPLMVFKDQSVEPEVRCRALQVLLQSVNPDSYSAILNVVNDNAESIQVRRHAVGALGRVGGTKAILELTSLLCDMNEELTLRAIGALSLGKIGGPSSIKALSQVIKDKNPIIRYKAFQGLECTGDKNALKYILRGLSDEDKYVRSSAIRAFGKLATTDYVPVIKDIYQRSGDVFIKTACIDALADLGGDQSMLLLKAYEQSEDPFLSLNAKNALRRTVDKNE